MLLLEDFEEAFAPQIASGYNKLVYVLEAGADAGLVQYLNLSTKSLEDLYNEIIALDKYNYIDFNDHFVSIKETFAAA